MPHAASHLRGRALALILAWPAWACAQAPSPTLTVATWNLGWHLSSVEAAGWIQRCGQRFARDPADRIWKPSPGGERTGWELPWGRNAPVQWSIAEWPPCDVYQDRFDPIAVTAQAYSVRQRQIREVLTERVQPDVIAFQEVSGEAAVREVLPENGRDWQVCSFTGYKVQRLAFAWRRALGADGRCEVHAPLSLPGRESREQPRPGLALTLRWDGPSGTGSTRSLRLMTLHLKSSCVSELDPATGRQPDRGRLDGPDEHCRILHDQIAPLEAWIEAAVAGVDGLVVLGDFNRNLAHESREPPERPARLRGAATDPHRPDVRVRNLWREVNDGQPAASRLRLLDTRCDDSRLSPICDASKQGTLAADQQQQLRAPDGLGCRNPIGLDHIAVGGAVEATEPARKVAVGRYGRSRAIGDGRSQPLLAISDHCPLLARIRMR
jgi:hypothetical protein